MRTVERNEYRKNEARANYDLFNINDGQRERGESGKERLCDTWSIFARDQN
jgi:hypothetical protein